MENYNENSVKIGGKVVVEPEFSHELFDEKFYVFYIETKRLSNYLDKIPVIISERLMDLSKIVMGAIFQIEGQFRSYNKLVDGKSRLILSIFARDINKVDSESYLTLNEANFVGYICKNPVYRKTPLGREITDVLIAVNRSYKKSDYIPCILWGRNAKFCDTLAIGTKVKLNGRIQSRTYDKKTEDGGTISKVAYEVSVSKFSVLDENKNVDNESI